MAWEWKEEAPVQKRAVMNVSESLGTLAIMAWVILFANIVFLIGFGLLIGFANGIYKNSETINDTRFFYLTAVEFSGGYFAGVALLVVSAVTIFVMGIVMLVVRKPYFRDQQLITATGVISVLGGLFIFSGILSIVVISKINIQRSLDGTPPRNHYETHPSKPSEPPIQTHPNA